MTDITQRIKSTIEEYKDAKVILDAAARTVKEAKQRVKKLEEDTLPTLLFEAEVDEMTLTDGTHIKSCEKVYTTVKKGERVSSSTTANTDVVKELTGLGVDPNDFFKPVYIVYPITNEDTEEFITALSNFKGVVNRELQYNPAQISALGAELLAEGKSLSEEFFSQHIKNSVKITQKTKE